MTNYQPPHGTYPGSEPPAPLPSFVRLDEPLNSSYLQTIGIDSLDGQAIGYYSLAGESTTQMGDYLTYQVPVGNAAEGIHYETGILIDVLGQGQGSVRFADRPDGTYAPLVQAPADAPTAKPGNTQSGGDGTGTDSTQQTTQGQTTTTTGVDEQTQEPVNTTTYEPGAGPPVDTTDPDPDNGGIDQGGTGNSGSAGNSG